MATKVQEVFIAGGLPAITYVPRENFELEESLQNYLDDGHQLICVTGPTKSGKTVLCKTVLRNQNPVWLDGGAISSEADFWNQLADKLDATESEELGTHSSDSYGSQKSGEIGISLPVVAVKGGGSQNSEHQTGRGRTTKVARSPKMQSLARLKAEGRCLVIDDFHYLSRELQTVIVRSMKGAIFDGARVVVLAVPHRAYDAVRVEKEMTGRVAQVAVPEWTQPELNLIAAKGFEALHVDAPSASIDRLVKESWANPHLMQRFCSRLCRLSKITERKDTLQAIAKIDFDFFFEDIAKDTGKKDFDRLSRGPRQRADRKVHEFSDGTSGDIYVVVLRALAETGPKSEITYEELREKIKSLLTSSTLQMHEVSRVLIKMSEKHEESDLGVPPVGWDAEDRKIHITDPFFAYYLKWGAFRDA